MIYDVLTNPEDFKVVGKIELSKIPTKLSIDTDKDQEEEALDKVQVKLSKKQDAMYAHNRYAFLICLQGMDTSGKDSLIREVFKEFNPRGVVVHSFKTPNSTELEHDYLYVIIWLCPKRKFVLTERIMKCVGNSRTS